MTVDTAVHLSVEPSTKSPPFGASLDYRRGTIVLDLPLLTTVEVRSSWMWKKILDRNHWIQQGVACSDSITIRIPCEMQARVRCLGRTWQLQVKRPPSRSARIDPKTRRAAAVSVLFHFGVLAAALSFTQLPRVWDLARSAIAREVPVVERKDTLAPTRFIPFAGVSWSVYRNRMSSPEDRLKRLVGGLDRAANGKVRVAANAIRAAVFRAPPLMNTARQDQTGGEKRITVSQESAVRQRFQGFSAEFDRALTSVLTLDPKLSITVSYEVEVQPNGWLRFRRLDHQGRADALAVTQLKKRLSETVETADVGKGLAGVLIRGELFFTAK